MPICWQVSWLHSRPAEPSGHASIPTHARARIVRTKPVLTLYLVRHGWTAWHSERRVAGWADVGLDERGQAEARAAGSWLAQRLSRRPKALLSSPVLRARQTAEAIATAFEPHLHVQLEPELGETRVAQWEGRLVEEIEGREAAWQEFFQAPADFRFPGGETGREVQARMVTAVEALHSGKSDQEFILVSHADPLRSLIAHYLGLEANNLYRLRVDCGSISCLRLRSGNSPRPAPAARLEFLNLTEHLILAAAAAK